MPCKAQIDVPVGVHARFERKRAPGGLHARLSDVGIAKEREQTIGAIVFGRCKFAQRDADAFSFQNLLHIANVDIAHTRGGPDGRLVPTRKISAARIASAVSRPSPTLS